MAKLKFGRHTSAKRALRESIKHQKINRAIKQKIHLLTKQLIATVEKKDKEESKKLLSQVVSKLDKAAKKGMLTKGTVRRRTSHLSKSVNGLISGA